MPQEAATRMREALLRYQQIAGGLAVVLYGILYMNLGLWRSATVELTYAALLLLTVVWARVAPSQIRANVWCNVVWVLVVVSLINWFQGGLSGAAHFICWGLISPVTALLFLGRKPAIFMGICLGLVAIFFALAPITAAESLPTHLVPYFNAGNVIGGSVLVLASLGYLLRKLVAENQRLDEIRESQIRAQKLGSLGTLAGGIAHDFNNILMAFSGNIHLARRELPPDHPADIRLGKAQQALEQATGLTEQLLTFARGGAPIRRVLRLAPLVHDAVCFVLHGTTASVSFDLESDFLVMADGTQLTQLVQNLAINGAQAMPEGGELRVSLCSDDEVDGPLPADLDSSRRYVVLRVQDEGGGIDPGIIDKIFDPYFTTRPDGTGLGLATALSIAANHDGTIRCSLVEQGACFLVFLPQAEGSVEDVEDSPNIASPRGLSLLVMDDEDAVRDVLSEMLRELGHTVDACAEGRAASRLYADKAAAGEPYDVVVLDLTIKGGPGGAATAEAILTVHPEAVLIASSGYANDPIMAEHTAYGFKAALRKPFTTQDLKYALAKVRPS